MPGIGPDIEGNLEMKRDSLFMELSLLKKILGIDEMETQRVSFKIHSKSSTIQKFALISLKSLPNITITQSHGADN